MTRLNHNGFTLLQLAVSIAVVGIGVLIVLSASTSIFKQSSKVAADTNTLTGIEIRNTFLKMRMNGPQSFQGLAFKYPDDPTLSTDSTGFVVLPNTDIDNQPIPSSSPSSDKIVFVMRTSDSAVAKLTQASNPGDTLQIKSTEGNSLRQAFEAGGVVIGTPQRSEIFFLTPLMHLSLPNFGTTGSIQLSTSNDSLKPTYSESLPTTALRFRYEVGDRLYKARLISIGMKVSTNELYVKLDQVGTSYPIGKDVTQFTVSYNLDGNQALCSSVSTGPDEFKRDQWSIINAPSNNGKCYRRIKQYKIEYTISGKNSDLILNANN